MAKSKFTKEFRAKAIKVIQERNPNWNKDFFAEMDIAEATWYDYLKKNIEFSEEVKKAENYWREHTLKKAAQNSLMELVTGKMVEEPEVVKEYVNDGTDKAAKLVVKSIKVKKKWIAPNTAAVIFALSNVDSDNFKNRQQTDSNVTGNLNANFKISVIDSTTPLANSEDDIKD